jgi:hypothetical protein
MTQSLSTHRHTGRRTAVRFCLHRHPVNALLPVGIRALIQDGMLEQAFQNALRPDFLFPLEASIDPVQGSIGQRLTRTRTGLLTPTTTPLTGDVSASTYSIEQFSGVLDQYGNSTDTNMLGSLVGQARKFIQDIQILGVNAGQSLNQLARNKLYASYAGGRTWCRTADAASNTSIAVSSTAGFDTVLVNGVPTAVSATNTLAVTINGVANTVTGVDAVNRTLTLGTARVDVLGDPIIATNAPITIRPNARATAYNLISTDTATIGLFFDAVARLRGMNVPPTADGTYHAHVDATTMRQLLSDTEFRQAFQSQGPADVYQQGRLTVFGGITFILNIETPTVSGDSMTVSLARRPIVVGADPIVAMPLEGQGQLLDGTGVETAPGISMVEVAPGLEVVLIVRPPQDRLQQVVSSSWAWTGDFAIATDSTSGDTAIVKRGVVIEHA